MNQAASVMAWAKRVYSRRNAPPYQLLDIRITATAEEAQQAFYKIARMAHPDLHRNALSADDLETLTTAYAIVAGAYQTFRSQPPAAVPAAAAEPEPPPAEEMVNPEQAMSSKALLYYRKAEAALQRGDRRSAMLQVKLAIAQDPHSTFLKAELEKLK